MKLSRRSFLKLTGTAAAATVLAGSGFKSKAAAADNPGPLWPGSAYHLHLLRSRLRIICHVQNGVVINARATRITRSTRFLCSKGSSLYNVSYIYDSKGRPKPNPNRLTGPLYRAPGGDKWEEKLGLDV